MVENIVDKVKEGIQRISSLDTTKLLFLCARDLKIYVEGDFSSAVADLRSLGSLEELNEHYNIIQGSYGPPCQEQLMIQKLNHNGRLDMPQIYI